MHKIRLIAKSKSIAMIGPIPLKDLIEGQEYEFWCEVENIGTTSFPGGILYVQINWPDQRIVRYPFKLDPLAPGQIRPTQIFTTGALARGYALFYAVTIKANDGKKVEVYQTRKVRYPPTHPKIGMYHIHSRYAKSTEEVTSYWAMLISAVSLTILVITTLVQLIHWLSVFE